MPGQILHCRVFVDDKPAALLTVTNAHTGTPDAADYRVELDLFSERAVIRTELKALPIPHTRLDLIAAAFRTIAQQEVAHATA